MGTALYLEIALCMKADAGVTEHVVCKTLSGSAWPKTGRIVAPEGKTRNQLYILAHECGHIALHGGSGKRPPVHRREYEAERYAHERMRFYGIAVPEKMTTRAKAYVAQKIRKAVKSGAMSIDREAASWAGVRL